MLSHLKILNSQKLSCLVGLFGLKSFHGFVSLAHVEDVTDYLSSVLFCIIVLLFTAGSSKNIKKHQYAPRRTHKKGYLILHRLLDENTLVF